MLRVTDSANQNARLTQYPYLTMNEKAIIPFCSSRYAMMMECDLEVSLVYMLIFLRMMLEDAVAFRSWCMYI